MYKKGSFKIKYKHLKTILQMDKVQKEQQSLKMNRSNVMVCKQEKMYISLPQVHVAVGRELYRKYYRMFCIHSFLAVSVHLVCVEKIGQILKHMRMRWKTERCEEIQVDCFVSRTKTHDPFGQLWKYIGFQFIIHSLLYIKLQIYVLIYSTCILHQHNLGRTKRINDRLA